MNEKTGFKRRWSLFSLIPGMLLGLLLAWVFGMPAVGIPEPALSQGLAAQLPLRCETDGKTANPCRYKLEKHPHHPDDQHDPIQRIIVHDQDGKEIPESRLIIDYKADVTVTNNSTSFTCSWIGGTWICWQAK